MEESGITVSDHKIILAIIGGLPHTYANAVSHFNSTSPSILTLDYVITQLLNEEIRPAKQSTSTTTADPRDVALADTPVAKGTCFFCDKPGHYKDECPEQAEFLAYKKTGNSHAQLAILDESTISKFYLLILCLLILVF